MPDTAAVKEADEASDESEGVAPPRRLTMATVVKPCLIGATLLTLVHAAIGSK